MPFTPGVSISRPSPQTELGNMYTNLCMHTYRPMLRLINIVEAKYWTRGPVGGPGLSARRDVRLY